jgi:hypothetical protein
MDAARQELVSGDILLLTYSGHGGVVGDPTEPDGVAETWCLWDGQLIDDEMYEMWRRFAAGVRIVVFCDSCYSKGMGDTEEINPATAGDPFLAQATDVELERLGLVRADLSRALPTTIAQAMSKRHRKRFANIRARVSARTTPQATILLFSACQANELAWSDNQHGAFTRALLKVWRGGAFRGYYRQLARQIQKRIETPLQSPSYVRIGAPDEDFEHQRPFSIAQVS